MSLAEIPISQAPRHLKVTGHQPAFGFEPCEDVGCLVPGDGVASSCGRLACPSCGCGGTNVASVELRGTGRRLTCTCGHTWLHGVPPVYVVTTAEIADCTCPEDCECDHGND